MSKNIGFFFSKREKSNLAARKSGAADKFAF